MADSYNATINQGETFVLTATVTGVNLSGYSARCKGRLSHEATATTWDKSTSGGGVAISSGTNSTVTLTLTATETAALTRWTAGVYDMEYESAGGVVTRFLQGTYIVTGEVTRA